MVKIIETWITSLDNINRLNVLTLLKNLFKEAKLSKYFIISWIILSEIRIIHEIFILSLNQKSYFKGLSNIAKAMSNIFSNLMNKVKDAFVFKNYNKFHNNNRTNINES